LIRKWIPGIGIFLANEGGLSMLTEISCRIESYLSRHEVFMLYVTVRFRPLLTKACIGSYPDPDSYHSFLIIILIFSSPHPSLEL
jgi:hypothetical protein